MHAATVEQPEHQEVTYADTGRVCKLYTEGNLGSSRNQSQVFVEASKMCVNQCLYPVSMSAVLGGSST